MKKSATLSKHSFLGHQLFRFALLALIASTLNLQPVSAMQAGNCSATPITPGQTVNGMLSSGDCVSPFNNRAADRYSFNGTAGQKVSILLNSGSLDTFLYLIGPDGRVVAQDDDSGGGRNARIPSNNSLALPSTGTYLIEATTSRSQTAGNYALRLGLGTSCTYLVTANLEPFPAAGGGGGTATISTAPDCPWNATSAVSWITISAPNSGKGNGIINFRLSANNNCSARTGQITVAGEALIVPQFGNPTACSAGRIKAGETINGTLSSSDSRSSFRINPDGVPYSDRYYFDVIAGQKIAVRLTSSAFATYLCFIGPDGNLFGHRDGRYPATGFQTVFTSGRYLIEATSSASGQTGSYALTLELVESRCSYEATAQALILPPADGSGSITVSAPNGCPWQAFSESDWITMETHASGSGAGSVTFIAEANSDEPVRTGRIAIGDKVVTFSQLGINPVSGVSAASFNGARLAPDSIVAAFGAGLATEIKLAETRPLPTTLAGTRVMIKDSKNIERNAELFFVSPDQINLLIPKDTASGAAIVTVTSGDSRISTGVLQIEPAAPGLFTANASGQGVPTGVLLRVLADGSQIYEELAQFDTGHQQFVPLPIDFGAETDRLYLVLFGTGIRNRSSLTNPSAKIGGIDAPVVYAGTQGSLIGVDQVNLQLPRELAGRGQVDVALTVDGVAANTVKVKFQ